MIVRYGLSLLNQGLKNERSQLQLWEVIWVQAYHGVRDDQTADHVKTSLHVLGDPIHHMRYTVQACLVAHLREHECDTLKHSVQRIKVKLVLAGTFKVFDDFGLDCFVNLVKSLAHFLV